MRTRGCARAWNGHVTRRFLPIVSTAAGFGLAFAQNGSANGYLVWRAPHHEGGKCGKFGTTGKSVRFGGIVSSLALKDILLYRIPKSDA
jgi:hypothetical protein